MGSEESDVPEERPLPSGTPLVATRNSRRGFKKRRGAERLENLIKRAAAAAMSEEQPKETPRLGGRKGALEVIEISEELNQVIVRDVPGVHARAKVREVLRRAEEKTMAKRSKTKFVRRAFK